MLAESRIQVCRDQLCSVLSRAGRRGSRRVGVLYMVKETGLCSRSTGGSWERFNQDRNSCPGKWIG